MKSEDSFVFFFDFPFKHSKKCLKGSAHKLTCQKSGVFLSRY